MSTNPPGPGDPRSAAARLSDLEELEVRVERLVAGGVGLARYEGIPLFVPRSAPGDRLRVRLTERRPDYGRAEIVEILQPGPGRRSPPCPYFERCGGCDLQHLEDDLQVRLKAEAVRETLERLGGIPRSVPVEVVSGAPWGYRLRTQLQVEAAPEGPPRVGYFRRGSHELVPVDRCPILVRELEGLLPRLPEALPAEPPRRLDLAVGSGAAWTTAPVVEGLPHGPVARTVAGHQLSYDARVFFQVHGGLLERLVERVVGPWSGAQAFDLYAGVGLFSLPLARLYDRVTAVEGDRIAARFCRNNGRKNRIGNLAVESRALESWIPNLPADVDRVVVDPPRAGLHRKLRSAFLERPPVRLTYVSCHPAALARDLKALARGFHLESLVLFDLFPQTGHMEAVAQLVAG